MAPGAVAPGSLPEPLLRIPPFRSRRCIAGFPRQVGEPQSRRVIRVFTAGSRRMTFDDVRGHVDPFGRPTVPRKSSWTANRPCECDVDSIATPGDVRSALRGRPCWAGLRACEASSGLRWKICEREQSVESLRTSGSRPTTCPGGRRLRPTPARYQCQNTLAPQLPDRPRAQLGSNGDHDRRQFERDRAPAAIRGGRGPGKLGHPADPARGEEVGEKLP
jgi:hypothetical protein